MIFVDEGDYIAHIGRSKRDGAPIGSGRYRLGSGEHPYQDLRAFRNQLYDFRRQLKAEGIEPTPTILAQRFGMTTREYRAKVTLAKDYVFQEDRLEALKLKDNQWSNSKIAEKLGCSVGRVNNLLAGKEDATRSDVEKTVDLLKASLDYQHGYIDLGPGSEYYLGVSKVKLTAAMKQLKDEGYEVLTVPFRQQFGKGNTNFTVLCPPGTTRGEVYNHPEDIRLPLDIKLTSDKEAVKLRPIENISSKRVGVRYAEDGGIEHGDGLIELRRGVKDLDLGNARYAQVRIGVDGTHFLKGMAVYSDDLPDGVDIMFNTNKKRGTPLIASEPGGKEVLKPMSNPENKLNPFGAAIRPGLQRGALNIINEEGHWDDWSKTLSSQFLSKQRPELAKQQLGLSKSIASAELDDISKLTNPVIKKYLLDKFGDSCDSDAVALKAQALPRQANKVLLPLGKIKETECYCPTLDNGEYVALIRHPHAGPFEIPILKNNTKNAQGKNLIGNGKDAIGIHPNAAGILSGADFDGDTVVAIPIRSANIKNVSPHDLDSNPILKKTIGTLRTFDPKESYPGDGLPKNKLMTKKGTGRAMGEITNLITDMSTKKPSPGDLTRAVKYSMVVIDAYKHKLDYRAAYKDFDIDGLKRKYQSADGKGGAGTILSRAKSSYYVPDRKEIKPASVESARKSLTPDEFERWKKGEKIYRNTGKVSYKGNPLQTKSTKMREAKDAYTLTSGGSRQSPGTVIERYYADYANHMKSLGNKARAIARSTKDPDWNRSAEKAYAPQVKSLNNKLRVAEMNAPKERIAQAIATSMARAELAMHPEYDSEAEKKARSRALEYGRAVSGSGKISIDITDDEWNAIQAGAISKTKLNKILENTDMDALRQRAMPRAYKSLSPAKIAQARNMLARGDESDGIKGYSLAEVASALGCSVDTLKRALNE